MKVKPSLTPSTQRGWKTLARVSACVVLALFAQAEQAAAQARNITGRIVTADLAPMAGVSVSVQGSSAAGAVTNASGNYTIGVTAPNVTLVFNAIGYQQVIEPLNGRAIINVTMQEVAISLQGVVAVGYGTQTRATVSGAVSSVTSDELASTSSTNTADALVGRLQGVSTRLTTSGTGRDGTSGTPADGRPGSATVLQIRNMGTPLYVIDGVPLDERDFAELNPADVEAISILKDASAAVYGFRAANGVVLVTTKKGSRVEAPRVRFDGYYGFQNFTMYHYDSTMTNAYEYQWSKVDSDQNRGLATRQLTKEELAKWEAGTAPGYQSTDHYPLVVNNPNAPQFSFNSSVSGGSDNSQYFLSAGFLKSEYVMKDNAFSRMNLRANLQSDITENFTIGAELSGRQEFQDNVAVQGSDDIVRSLLLGIHSSWPMENPWLDPERQMIAFDVRRIDRTVAMYSQDISGGMSDYNRRVGTNLWAQYELPFGSTLRATGSVNYGWRNFNKQQFDFTAFTCTNKQDLSTCREVATPAPRVREQVTSDALDLFGSLEARHQAEIGQNSLGGTLAFELTGGDTHRTQITATPPNNLSHLIRFSEVTNVDNTWGISRRASLATAIRYDYADKYLVDFLGRYDGSYLYASDSRWGFFPGVTLGWRITQEPFMQDRFGFLNELKLRASIGQTGREQGVNAWGYLGGGTYNSGGAVFGNSFVPGLAPRGLPVTELSWVTSTTKNLGFDLILFDNKLSAEFDVFERSLTGLPAARTDVLVPQEIGYTLPNENLEASATKGFEFALNYSDRIGAFRYSLAPNFTVARTMQTVRYNPRFGNSWDEFRNGDIGRWSGTNFGYKFIKQFETIEEIESFPVNQDGSGNRTMLPGDFIVEDTNNDGIINTFDMRVIGYGDAQTPLYSAGTQLDLSYRGISLNLNWQGGAGYSHSRGAETKNMFQGDHNGQRWVMDRWHRADPYNPQSEWIPGRYQPHRQTVTHVSTSRNDTFWRTNVKYARLRQLEIGYAVPDVFSSNFGLQGVRVYTNSTNPLTFSNTAHYRVDPEIQQGTALNYPTTRVITVGFNASLGGARTPTPIVPVPPAD